LSRRLPEPVPQVKRTLALLPHEPGVYILRDRAGRIIYVGRSRDLATRVRSYWIDLKDRPHLARMVARVEWVEPVVCASEHEAAFLESDLLERHPTRFNRTLGMESCVWLRLDGSSPTPDLTVMHEVAARDGAEWFGPYLGWEPARQATVGLLRLYPLRHSGAAISRSDRELGRSLGVSPADMPALAHSIRRVLRRDTHAVRDAVRDLEEIRDRAADCLNFEHAAAVQEQIRGLRWISQVQKLASLDPVDGDFAAMGVASSAAVQVVLSLRGGRLIQRHLRRLPDAGPGSAAAPDDDWAVLAQRNADLMAKLAATDAIGPLGWRD
jgi:excinuclease ABC subunit C